MFYSFAERSFLFQKDLLFSLKDLLHFFRKDLLQFRVMNEVCNIRTTIVKYTKEVTRDTSSVKHIHVLVSSGPSARATSSTHASATLLPIETQALHALGKNLRFVPAVTLADDCAGG
jgi:hypothetical protein